jgi:ATP-dependent Lon protease
MAIYSALKEQPLRRDVAVTGNFHTGESKTGRGHLRKNIWRQASRRAHRDNPRRKSGGSTVRFKRIEVIAVDDIEEALRIAQAE